MQELRFLWLLHGGRVGEWQGKVRETCSNLAERRLGWRWGWSLGGSEVGLDREGIESSLARAEWWPGSPPVSLREAEHMVYIAHPCPTRSGWFQNSHLTLPYHTHSVSNMARVVTSLGHSLGPT